MQNVGNALGVAMTGVIFFGALNEATPMRSSWRRVELAVLLVSVAALTRLLPAPRPVTPASEPVASAPEPVQ